MFLHRVILNVRDQTLVTNNVHVLEIWNIVQSTFNGGHAQLHFRIVPCWTLSILITSRGFTGNTPAGLDKMLGWYPD